MATVTIYKQSSGATYNITIVVDYSVVTLLNNGELAYYITVSTTAKDPLGQTILPRVITDADITDSVDTAVKDAIVSILIEINGGMLSSSSSSESSASSASSGFDVVLPAGGSTTLPPAGTTGRTTST